MAWDTAELARQVGGQYATALPAVQTPTVGAPTVGAPSGAR
jgi:hypothetical protein